MILVRDSLNAALFGEKPPRFCAFIGGGGKTTAIAALSREFLARGDSVIVTATTKMCPPEDLALLADSSAAAREILKTGKLCYAGAVIQPKHKMRGLPDFELFELKKLADRVLAEADGSRGMPLKAPRDFEPVIPKAADAVVFVLGLDGIGKPVSQSVHCPELACELLGVPPEHLVTAADAARIFSELYTKKAAEQNPAAALIVLLNKYDGGLRAKAAETLSRLLCDYRVVVR